ncbi:DUF1852 domain-containing protein [Vibrio sp.]|nr:DUF1852 domain-containing protein [Vibrio sp.]
MNTCFSFTIKKTPFDVHYQPSSNTRTTTNFANLARGVHREDNLNNVLTMIDNRFNTLAHWDNLEGDRYSVTLDIISVNIELEGSAQSFPSIEILKTNIIDKKTQETIEGIVGNNFSSYVRDYDFSVVLLEHNKNQTQFSIPDNFGELHGSLYQALIRSDEYQRAFTKSPVICLSVSDNKTYHQINNQHPILGTEYQPNESSLTEHYFKKMGLNVRYFMPKHSVAPLAFYFSGDLLNDYTNLELISTISTMETFQKIYRPEIYNANTAAGTRYRPNLNNQDHSLTKIIYDREERSQLAIEQGKFAQEHFVLPYQAILKQLSTSLA